MAAPIKLATVASNIPLGRFGEPEEMAHLAMALLDGYNMFTTGQSFMVAGGYNMKLDSIAGLVGWLGFECGYEALQVSRINFCRLGERPSFVDC